jgi:hypothetical protein
MNLLKGHLGAEKAAVVLGDMKKYLLTRNVRDIFNDPDRVNDRLITLEYDIPGWLAGDGQKRLCDLAGRREYAVSFDQKVKAMTRDFIRMNKDADLSLQIMYRDGTIRDFWPQWVEVGERR